MRRHREYYAWDEVASWGHHNSLNMRMGLHFAGSGSPIQHCLIPYSKYLLGIHIKNIFPTRSYQIWNISFSFSIFLSIIPYYYI